MFVAHTPLEGLLLLKPRRHQDDRGWFAEVWNDRTFRDAGIDAVFVQDNESFSQYGVLRGLHYQKGASAQIKLVRVVMGEILDVALDLRSGSPTFGQHHAVRLSAENACQLYIPTGFAHGFSVLSDAALVAYKCGPYWDRAAEGALDALDPALGIDWGVPREKLIRSAKDAAAPSWASYAADPDFFGSNAS